MVECEMQLHEAYRSKLLFNENTLITLGIIMINELEIVPQSTAPRSV